LVSWRLLRALSPVTTASSLAWNAAGLAAGGVSHLPCLPLQSAGLAARVRRTLSSWCGRDQRTVSCAPPIIESLLDDLGTGGWRIRRDTARAIAHIYGSARPAGVIEFGSGVSTVVFAALAQVSGSSTRTVSIEESPAYAETTWGLLKRYNLTDFASVIVAPVEQQTINGWRGFTYRPDPSTVALALGNIRPDLLFIDGPASWLRRRSDCRFGTLLVGRQFAATRALFVADDAFRRRERAILRHWNTLDGVDVMGILPVGRGLGIGLLNSAGQPPA
jgi:hypothetical protein